MRPGGSCARCTPPGCARPARPWCSSATSTPDAALDAAEAALGGWTGAGRASELPPTPPLGPGPLLLADRPGVGAVVAAAGAAGGAAHPPRPRRAAAGQPDLRRLLLVPLGGEHPRGQGLHVRPALAGRALDRRLGADPRRRGGHRGDRAGAAGDLVRAGPAGHACRPARRSWSRPGSTPWARCCSACRPRPGWPAWPAPTPATGCGWTSWPSTPAGWPRPPGTRWPRRPRSYLAPAKAVTVVLGDADDRGPSWRPALRRTRRWTAAAGRGGAVG